MLVWDSTAEKNRVEKLLEDAQIKLSVVASDIFGVSGRAMMAALIAGERDPQVLAQLARTRMRTKLRQLRRGVRRAFHRASPVPARRRCCNASTPSRVDITEVEARIEAEIAAFAEAVTRLD